MNNHAFRYCGRGAILNLIVVRSIVGRDRAFSFRSLKPCVSRVYATCRRAVQHVVAYSRQCARIFIVFLPPSLVRSFISLRVEITTCPNCRRKSVQVVKPRVSQLHVCFLARLYYACVTAKFMRARAGKKDMQNNRRHFSIRYILRLWEIINSRLFCYFIPLKF